MDRSMIPLLEPEIKGNEWKYVKDCLDTGWVSSVGKYVNDFERAIADFVGVKYAVACSTGTAALHVSLVALGIKEGQEVVVPSVTFIAPANAVRYTGAHPVFMDADPLTWQMDVVKLKGFLETACRYRNGRLINIKTGRRVTAILPVHVLGHPVNMEPLIKIAAKYGLPVIEDATESLGATYKGVKTGALGRVGCFSFNGNKIITCGGGGMVVTNDKRLAEQIRYLTTQAKDDPIEYTHGAIGYNYRLTNVQAAIGLAQMESLLACINAKEKIAHRYTQALTSVPGIKVPFDALWATPNYWLYTILVESKIYGASSRELLKKAHQHGIQCRPLWHPLHSLKIFKDCFSYQITEAPKLYRDSLSIPSSAHLKSKQQEQVIALIQNKVGKKV
jgi:perosamine synthetase